MQVENVRSWTFGTYNRLSSTSCHSDRGKTIFKPTAKFTIKETSNGHDSNVVADGAIALLSGGAHTMYAPRMLSGAIVSTKICSNSPGNAFTATGRLCAAIKSFNQVLRLHEGEKALR